MTKDEMSNHDGVYEVMQKERAQMVDPASGEVTETDSEEELSDLD